MKGSEWMLFCIEKRTSKKQKEIMFFKRINQQHEKRLVALFKEKEKEWFVLVAIDITRRHVLTFTAEDGKDGYFWVEYSKKEKRFTHIKYEEHGCWHYIFLKHCIYLRA